MSVNCYIFMMSLRSYDVSYTANSNWEHNTAKWPNMNFFFFNSTPNPLQIILKQRESTSDFQCSNKA